MLDCRLHPALKGAVAAAAVALAAAGAPRLARAEQAGRDQAPRVGVAVSVRVNVEPAEAEAVADALGRALRETLVVDVIAGAEAARRLPPDGLPESCVIEKPCVKDVAQRLAADELLFLVVVKVGSRIQVDPTWVEVRSGRAVPRGAVVIEDPGKAQALFAAAASQLLPSAARRTAADQPALDPRPPEGEPVAVVRRRGRRMTAASWITAGVGAAALAGAVGFTLAARSDYKECDDSGTCSDGRLDTLERKALAADILWGTAAVAAIATAALYVTSGGEIERVPAGSAALRLAPARGAAVGLALEGTW